MGAFFIAFLFIVFISGKLLKEQSNYWGLLKARVERNRIEEQTKPPEGVCDPPKTPEEFWIMADSVGDDLAYVFGDNWRKVLQLRLRELGTMLGLLESSEFRGCPQIAYAVWLSKKGYIINNQQDGFKPYVKGYGPNNKKAEDISLRALETIEKNLRIAHPDLSLTLRNIKGGWHYMYLSPYLVWEHWANACGVELGERLW